MRKLLIISFSLLLALPAVGDTVTADFEDGINLGNWTFSAWSDGINTTGGNPGAWYSSQYYWCFWPVLQCESANADFTGDFAAMGVTTISGDFISLSCENPYANEWPFTVLLRNDMGTPEIDDDFFVYPDPFNWLIPQIGAGWTHYDFTIPSDFEGGLGELPAGWLGGSSMTGGDIFPADKTFQDVMTNVTTIEFHWQHPAYFTYDCGWEVGGDNITLEYEGGTATESISLGELKTLYR